MTHTHPIDQEAELEACDCPACQTARDEAWQDGYADGTDAGSEEGAEEVFLWLKQEVSPRFAAVLDALAVDFWAYFHSRGGVGAEEAPQ